MSFKETLAKFRKDHPYQTIEIGNVTFRYVRSGDSDSNHPPLVFLNGGMNVSEMWMDYLTDLSRDYRVLLFDYPMGLNTNQDLVRGMHQFFSALQIKDPVLIGASDGGMVAQIYTQKYPDEVGGLVLIATGGMDASTIKSLKRKYFFAPIALWYIKHCNYEKLKPTLIKSGMQHTKNESAENKAYAKEMFETVFADYPQEKDVHITGLLADLMKQTPVTGDTFLRLKGKILLILPSADFFTPKMQSDLIALMHEPKIRNINGGHIATVLQVDEYIKELRLFLSDLFVS